MSSSHFGILLTSAISCLADILNLPAAPANGQRNISSVSVGSTVTYSCDAGYKLIGPSTVTCLTNRKWSVSGNAIQCFGKSIEDYYYNATEFLNYYNFESAIAL